MACCDAMTIRANDVRAKAHEHAPTHDCLYASHHTHIFSYLEQPSADSSINHEGVQAA